MVRWAMNGWNVDEKLGFCDNDDPENDSNKGES